MQQNHLDRAIKALEEATRALEELRRFTNRRVLRFTGAIEEVYHTGIVIGSFDKPALKIVVQPLEIEKIRAFFGPEGKARFGDGYFELRERGE